MRLAIVSKNDLHEAQAKYQAERLAAPEHREDGGPAGSWKTSNPACLYAFVLKELNLPVAIAGTSGCPVATAAWWIEKPYRGQRLGNELVDLLAGELKRLRVSAIADSVLIDTYHGEYNKASAKLVDRLRAHFLK